MVIGTTLEERRQDGLRARMHASGVVVTRNIMAAKGMHMVVLRLDLWVSVALRDCLLRVEIRTITSTLSYTRRLRSCDIQSNTDTC